MSITYKYNSLEDFINSYPLNIDGILDDGWGAKFPVKGIELNATILFADITSFSSRTLALTPIETLIFVNNFLAWMSAEAIKNSSGVIDKYIGDELMVVFANEFGAKDHFVEAIQAARRMIDNDALDFHPHIGIASGDIVIGYTGTPLKYNCSVFGQPVAMASRCSAVKSDHINSIVFPSFCWQKEYLLDDLFPPREWCDTNGKTIKEDQDWMLSKPRTEKMKNMNDVEILELYTQISHLPSLNATERAKRSFAALKEAGFHRPLFYENK